MLTQERLKELLHYDPLTGDFTRLIQAGSANKGDRAGSDHNMGYLSIRVDNKAYLSHRLAHLYMTGKFPIQTDHDDQNRKNNKWLNICQSVTNQENNRNQTLRITNSSGFTGVVFNDECKRKWSAQITVDGKNIQLGRFFEKEDAILARKAGNEKYGFHVNHGAEKCT